MKLNIFFLLLILSLVACEKDVDEFTPYNQRNIEWPEVLGITPEYHSFNAEENNEITLGAGELLIIPANTMVNNSGQILSGKIDLSLTHIRKKGDFIFSYMNSNTPSGLLQNHHIVNIKAYQNTNPIKINSAKKITLQAPTNYEIEEGNTWMGHHTTPNNFEWTSAFNSIDNKTWTVDGESYSGVAYTTSQLGWISGATPLITEGHQLCVSFNEAYDIDKTKVFFIFEDQFVVAELKLFSDSHQFCTTIPEETTGHIIIINQDGDKFNFQKETVTVTEDLNFTGHPIPTVLETIVIALNAL